MTEAVQEKMEGGHETGLPAGQAGVTGTVFEPEILAFCCEH